VVAHTKTSGPQSGAGVSMTTCASRMSRTPSPYQTDHVRTRLVKSS